MNKFDIENVIKEAEKHWAEWEKAGLPGNLESIVRLAYARGEQNKLQESLDGLPPKHKRKHWAQWEKEERNGSYTC